MVIVVAFGIVLVVWLDLTTLRLYMLVLTEPWLPSPVEHALVISCMRCAV